MESAQPIALGQVAIRLPATRRESHQQAQALSSDFMSPVDTVTIENAVPAANAFDEIEFSLGSHMKQDHLPPSLASLLEEIKRHLEEALQKARASRPDFFERLQEIQEQLEDAPTAERLDVAGSLMAATSPEALDEFSASLEAVVAAARKARGQVEGGGVAAHSLAMQVSSVKLALNLDPAKGVSVLVDELKMAAGPAGSEGAALNVSHGKLSA